MKIQPRMFVTTRPGSTAPAVGTLSRDDSTGAEYLFVTAGASISAGDAVHVNADLTDVRPCSAANQVVLGVAPAAIASGKSGWIQISGKVTAKVVGSTAVGSPLVSTTTAGTLGLADATAFGGVAGVALVTGVGTGSAVYLR